MMIRWAGKLAPSLATLSCNPVLKHVLSQGDVMSGQGGRNLPSNFVTHRIDSSVVSIKTVKGQSQSLLLARR